MDIVKTSFKVHNVALETDTTHFNVSPRELQRHTHTQTDSDFASLLPPAGWDTCVPLTQQSSKRSESLCPHSSRLQLSD